MPTQTPKQLADGQLAATTGDLYTVPASTTSYITQIILVNTNTSVEEVNLYVLPSAGTARRIIPVDTQLQPGYALYFDSRLVLDTADKIRGDTTTAAYVDYTIYGAEEA